MEPATFDLAARDILAVLPTRADDLDRLRALSLDGPRPVVTVIGKYNHGKSRLLNELVGADVFAVADRRETVALAEHPRDDVRWLDAPGLDADVDAADDRHAHRAAWELADVRLFVHAVKEGELDAAELALLGTLHADGLRTRRRTVFLLTQIDQMPDPARLAEVTGAIASQVASRAPTLNPMPVSASRHRQGLDGGKRLLVERSGIPALKAALNEALAGVPRARAHETAARLDEIRHDLQRAHAECARRLDAARTLRHAQRQAFDQGLEALLDKARSDLRPVLHVDGADPALVPDSFQNMFKLTAGKVERSRIQVAYSRVCIALDAHLVRHGVVGLPVAQRTSVTSLDTVMVAVMGVSVKYREDLRRLFFEPEGRAALMRDFARYFELSEERQALGRRIVDDEAATLAAEQALRAAAALRTVRPA